MAPEPPVTSAVQGRAPYLQYCATCHGTDLRGGLNAPSLRGVAAADVDFMLSTGRMPAPEPQNDLDDIATYFDGPNLTARLERTANVRVWISAGSRWGRRFPTMCVHDQ